MSTGADGHLKNSSRVEPPPPRDRPAAAAGRPPVRDGGRGGTRLAAGGAKGAPAGAPGASGARTDQIVARRQQVSPKWHAGAAPHEREAAERGKKVREMGNDGISEDPMRANFVFSRNRKNQ